MADAMKLGAADHAVIARCVERQPKLYVRGQHEGYYIHSDIADLIGMIGRASPPAREEAPDEGAGFGVDDLAQEIRRVDGNHNLGAGALAEALMPFLRARTSEPAREASFLGHVVMDAVFIPKGEPIPLMGGRGKVTPVYDGPQNVTATADKLKVAKEALGKAKGRIQSWPIDDHETCMCGSLVEGHDIGSGHSPVSQADHAISTIVQEIDQALAALTEEG